MGAIVIVALGIAWVAGSYLLMAHAPHFAWNGVVIVGPMLASMVWLGAQRHWATLAVGAAAALLGLVALAASGGGVPLETLYLAQHVAVHVVLAVVFAQSLSGAGDSLVTAMARRVHGGVLTPAMASYSRRVTVAWVVYFLAMASLSVALFLLAPLSTWAAFANFATPLAMFAMFVGEHVLRYRLHPEFERVTLRQAVRAWQQRGSHESAV